MTALIPSIYITNDYKNIYEYFLNQKSPNLQNLKDDNSSLFITPQNNRYLESFEISYNLDKADRDSLTLVVIDTDGQFEKKLIGFQLAAEKKAIEENLAEARRKLISGSRLQINAELNKLISFSVRQSQIYVAFGAGKDFTEWSEPKVFKLTDSSVDISNNNIRRYTLKFAPSYYSIFRPKLIFNLEKPNPESEFFYTNQMENVIGSVKISKTYDTLSKIIYGLIKDYLISITGVSPTNIIGIIPELDIKSNSSRLLNGAPTLNPEIAKNCGILISQDVPVTSPFSNKLKQTNPMPPGATIDAQQEAQARNNKGEWYYFIMSEKFEDTELNPTFPNFYKPLNILNTFIRSKLKEGSADNLVVIEENDCRILKFFYEKGLISNPEEKCIIFGPERMIHTWLYRDMAPAEESANVEQLLNSAANPNIDLLTPKIMIAAPANPPSNNPNTMVVAAYKDFRETQILSRKEYSNDFYNYLSKRKTNSNFSESTNLDELAINDMGKQLSTALKSDEIKKLFNLLSIPIFTNNLKNSNILELQLLNSENYLMGLNISVMSNMSRFFLSRVNSNLDLINMGDVSLSSLLDETNKLLNDLVTDPDILEFLNFENKFRDPSIPLGSKIDAIKFYINKYLSQTLSKLTNEQLTQLGSIYKVDEFFDFLINNQNDPAFRALTNFDYQKIKKFLLNPKIKKIFFGYTKLIVQNKGNINFDELLFAYSIRQLTTNNGSEELLSFRGGSRGSWPDDNNYSKRENDLLYLLDLTSNREEIPKDRMTSIVGTDVLPAARNTLNQELSLYEKYYQYATFVIGLFKKDLNDKTGVRLVPKTFGLGEDEIMSDLFDALSRQSWKISIKTLPFFWLSNQRLVAFKPCFLFSKQVNLIGEENNFRSMDFFSGMYNIVSFKHVINTKEAYSEFILLRRAFNSSIT